MTPWLASFPPASNADRRLILFPHAAAGPRAFSRWRRGLAAIGDCFCVQLPGREERWEDPVFTDFAELADAAREAIRPVCRPPFFLIGHSFGGMLAYEIARRLVDAGGPLPSGIVVSSCHPPDDFGGAKTPTIESIADLRNVLCTYSGTPPELLGSDEMLRWLLPAARADFLCVRGYRFAEFPPLPIPLAAVGGTDDPLVVPSDLERWGRFTSSRFQSRTFAGGHFYWSQSDRLWDWLRPQIADWDPSPRPGGISP